MPTFLGVFTLRQSDVINGTLGAPVAEALCTQFNFIIDPSMLDSAHNNHVRLGGVLTGSGTGSFVFRLRKDSDFSGLTGTILGASDAIVVPELSGLIWDFGAVSLGTVLCRLSLTYQRMSGAGSVLLDDPYLEIY